MTVIPDISKDVVATIQGLGSSGMLRSFDWLLVTDVSVPWRWNR